MSPIKKVISIILNLVLVYGAWRNIRITIPWYRPFTLNYYTELSNLAGGILAIIYVIFTLIYLIRPDLRIPKIIQILKFLSVTCLAVTFLVVATILGPQSATLDGYLRNFLNGSVFYSHLLNPLVAMIAWVAVDAKDKLRKTAPFYALLPTILYGAVMIYKNIQGTVRGPYFFLEVTRNPLPETIRWAVIVLAINLAVAAALYALGKRIERIR